MNQSSEIPLTSCTRNYWSLFGLTLKIADKTQHAQNNCGNEDGVFSVSNSGPCNGLMWPKTNLINQSFQ